MKARLLSLLFMDFANMLRSGIGLQHSLRTISETAVDERVRQMCVVACGGLEKGVALSAALSVSGTLPRDALTVIEAGEQAGELPMVFDMLGEYYELKAEIQNKIFTAFGYPAAVIVILTGVMFYVVFEVIPKVSVLLPASAVSSPATGILLGSAVFLRGHGLTMGLLLSGLIGVGIYYSQVRPETWRMLLARVPLLGQLIKEQELALGFFALYMFQKSGVAQLQALREAARVAGGLTGKHMEECASYLVGGLALSEAVRQDKYFPSFTADTLRVGEESGRFVDYFERLYRVYYRSFQSKMEMLSASVRPGLLMVSAVFILLIAIGFLKPLYSNLTNIALP
ncbi:MAG: type II secretion system F family protein [Candidatus Omnitrophica bacterium]|nr:type II secretion system F family protein [Candidatus Omnitrophota bacterium]